MGKSLLDTHNAGDTLEISLGNDKGIVVERKKQKEFTSRQSLGGNKTDYRAYEIIVRNNKQQAVNITVQDQFPVSTDKAISVENKKYDGAELEEKTQILTWKLALAPKEEKKLGFRYSVKYPKGQVLILD